MASSPGSPDSFIVAQEARSASLHSLGMTVWTVPACVRYSPNAGASNRATRTRFSSATSVHAA